MVIERGFAGTRISDVAKRLDVSSSLIHYHFDSKEQLLAEAFAHYARKDLAELEAEVQAAPTALGQLDHAIHNYVPEGSDDVEWMLWIDGWGEALRNPMMRKISQELDEQSAELLERVIARRRASRGEFVCPDPRASAMRLTALVDGLAVQFAAHDGMMDRDQLIEHVQSLAAWEVGIDRAAFDEVGRRTRRRTRRPAVAGHRCRAAPARRPLLRRVQPGRRGDVRRHLGRGRRCGASAAKPITGSAAIVAEWTERDDQVRLGRAERAADGVRGRRARTAPAPVGSRCRSGSSAAPAGSAGLLGTYHDVYVRHGRDWLFAERRLEVLERS